MPIQSSSIINRTYTSNMTDYDWCSTCGEKSGYGLMNISAHCEMSACDQYKDPNSKSIWIYMYLLILIRYL